MALTFEAARVRGAWLPIPGRLTDNEQMESIPKEPEFDPIVPSKAAADAEQRAHRKALKALTARWGEQHQTRVGELLQELCIGSPDPGGDERAIYQLVATSTAVSELLGKAQLQLAERVGQLVDEHKVLLAVAKALREVTQVQATTMRSVEQLLAAAGTLRAQRRLVDSHAKRTWHAEVGGDSIHHARRDSSTRPEATN